jgi:hypothetical protein
MASKKQLANQARFTAMAKAKAGKVGKAAASSKNPAAKKS